MPVGGPLRHSLVRQFPPRKGQDAKVTLQGRGQDLCTLNTETNPGFAVSAFKTSKRSDGKLPALDRCQLSEEVDPVSGRGRPAQV